MGIYQDLMVSIEFLGRQKSAETLGKGFKGVI